MAAQPSVRDRAGGRPEDPPGGSPSSLVPNRESLGEATPLATPLDARQHCPKKPLDVVAIEAPELRFPASCDAYWCEVCGPRKAQQVAALMTWAARRTPRRRLVTLTGFPEDWQKGRAQVFDYLRRLRSDGYRFEMAWAVEANPRGTGHHVHGVQHGDYVPQAVLQERWGGRIVDVRALSRPGAGVYAVKEALRVAGYVTKGARAGDEQALSAHLERNGGRAAHMTRGFLHGKTKREALADLRRELASGQEYSWALVPAGAPAPSPADARRLSDRQAADLDRWR